MAYEDDMEDDVEEMEEESSGSHRAQPRFGPFLTIAVAILLLFGAASRVGRDKESVGWLDVDGMVNRNLEQESRRRQEEIATTIVQIGNVASQDTRRETTPPPSLNTRAMPPSRSNNGLGMAGPNGGQTNFLRPAPMTSSVAPMPDDFDDISEGEMRRGYFDPAPEASSQPRAGGGAYVVKTGDNWIKVGKKTGHNWRDIEKINPESRDGLRVGMRLTLPGG